MCSAATGSTSRTLTADDLEETHPHLPDDFRRSMHEIRRRGGPWPCGACGGPSYIVYRCSACGRNLVDESSATAGVRGHR